MRVYSPGAPAGCCAALGVGVCAVESGNGLSIGVEPKTRVNSPDGGTYALGAAGAAGLPLCFCFRASAAEG